MTFVSGAGLALGLTLTPRLSELSSQESAQAATYCLNFDYPAVRNFEAERTRGAEN
jgi:hypothetical protein